MEHVAGQQERLFRKVWNVKVVVLENQVDQHHPEVDHDALGIAGGAGWPKLDQYMCYTGLDRHVSTLHQLDTKKYLGLILNFRR